MNINALRKALNKMEGVNAEGILSNPILKSHLTLAGDQDKFLEKI